MRQDATPDLPQIFDDERAERPRAELSRSSSLCAAAVVHRKIHTVEMEHKAKVNERLDMTCSYTCSCSYLSSLIFVVVHVTAIVVVTAYAMVHDG